MIHVSTNVTRVLFVVAVLFSAWSIETVVQAQIDEADLGQLAGQITNLQGQRIYVGRAAVFLCDAATGMPIHRETKKPIRPTMRDPQIDKLWVVESDDRGAFEFGDVLVGKYRLVAQSWSGTAGFPGFDSNLNPSSFVILHGVCEEVEVKSRELSSAQVKQLGNHVLRITNDPEEPHALLLISLKPTLGDGILGPFGWGREFCRNLIGVTQMEVPFVTIAGLPEKASVHVGLMNYDNNPGFGAANYEPGQRDGKLRIVASWSNGHKDPPPELTALTEYLEKNEFPLKDLFDSDQDFAGRGQREALHELAKMLETDNDRVVKIGDLGETRLADVIAAYGYIELKKLKK